MNGLYREVFAPFHKVVKPFFRAYGVWGVGSDRPLGAELVQGRSALAQGIGTGPDANETPENNGRKHSKIFLFYPQFSVREVVFFAHPR